MLKIKPTTEIKYYYIQIYISMRKTEYIMGTFTDYTGRQRNYVMAAVSIQGEAAITIYENYCGVDTDEKVLSIGISVCRPNDEFNVELGKRIAEGKAIKYRNHALYVTDAGLINLTMVRALLEQESEYFETNPGRYLAGYDKDAAKYRESERIESYIDSLDDAGKAALTYFTSLKEEEPIQQFVDALNYVK